MDYKKGKHRFLPFLLALAMVCANASITFPVTVYAEDDGQEIPNAEEIVGTLEARGALAMSPYVSGQGGTMQIAMLDPANELTFRILASGKGLKNHFPQTSIENQLTVYDSNQEIVNADASSNFGDLFQSLCPGGGYRPWQGTDRRLWAVCLG